MAAASLTRLSGQGWGRIGLCILLLVSLFLLSRASENSVRFDRLYGWLLLINSVALVLLVALIGANLWRLVRQYRSARAGSRLTARLLLMLVALTFVPVTVVYLFSVQSLRGSIDSWFDVRVEQALDDALTLSQASLDQRMRDLLRNMELLAEDLAYAPDAVVVRQLEDMRAAVDAAELALLGGSGGHVIAVSSREPATILPNQPERALFLQLRQGHSYVGLDPTDGGGLQIRVLVPVLGGSYPREVRVLQALFPVPTRISELAENVQEAYGDYRELMFLRQPLKQSFIITLSLVLLLSLLFAIWTAFYLARRLVEPVRELAEGTRALAAGDYGTQLTPAGRDELGFLVQSFNDMSRRIAQTRQAAKRSQAQVERQRAYLEAVLSRLSSGVIAFDYEGSLRTFNDAAGDILAVPLSEAAGLTLSGLADAYPHLEGFAGAVAARLADNEEDWREELTLEGPDGRRILICSGARLPGGHGSGGYVVVLDDVTTLIQAQRDAAWGEVARRLAHEIKNPLTPIQLSAERIRHKYLEHMEGRDAQVLERATRTIVQQVDAMKAMVNAFSEYARPPQLEFQALDLNRLVTEVVELYRSGPDRPRFILNLDERLPAVFADPGRLRQLLHNLIKNAQEAAQDASPCEVRLTTRRGEGRQEHWVEIQIQDNGPGFAGDVREQLFEPYVTTKPKGTGLGLAIVKKIVEEHNGTVAAMNADIGAQLTIRLPIVAAVAPIATHHLPKPGDASL
ncbi:two-component sensor histidine kinase [Alkalilimnicola ehrlichii]|uniref:histidine kinase n=1 Tax=Alkalilimnicola ehrlichii TaxID=351052 RepID=A0A3E0WIS0_9GAMM|nr:ATP-binding protein [Alkalilimnicola ehrlichii]RFA24762.1 two-component sensor histidine kinase [Alkalilimnicola ehrlichii]RFA32007.1 two-component sensor histidine kinase [Alkalilimnicola ehrlichii]